jgi:hypothetical protein
VIVIGFACGAERANAANWRPVTQQDLKFSAADIGDPEADAAVMFREGELTDTSAEGTNLKLYIRIKIFNERGRRFVDIQLPYSIALGRITDVGARTIRPDGSIIEVQGRDIFDRVLFRSSHGVWRAKVFSMPGVEAGSIIEYRYRQNYPQGFKYFALDLQSDLFTRELIYRIQPQAASKLDVRWASFNVRDDKRFVPVWDGTYNIRAENIPPFRREPLMPPELTVKMWGWLYYSDETETNPEKYWKAYATRMHAMATDETKPSEAIRRVVESITSASNSPPEKIGRIYNYVQTEIRNIGFRDERKPADAEQPPFEKNDSADETIRRRYGTPREINRLFIAMMRAVGFDARVAELTTRDENFFRRTFPDSFQFNGEVAAVVGRETALQFFDPGTLFCPMGVLSWEKQAVPALVYGKRDWRFVETPVAEAANNTETRKLMVEPQSDGSVAVEAGLSVGGQRAIELRSEIVDLNSDDLRKSVAGLVRDNVPSAVVDESSVLVSNVANANMPLEASCKYNVPQAAVRTERRMLLKPARLAHSNQTLLPAERRSNGVYFSYPWSEVDHVVIKVPHGFEVERLPDAVVADIGAATYRATFRLDSGNVVFERRLVVNGISFAVDQYATVKGFFDRIHQADGEGVVFIQSDSTSRPVGPLN